MGRKKVAAKWMKWERGRKSVGKGRKEGTGGGKGQGKQKERKRVMKGRSKGTGEGKERG